jgi:diguanylate cyclase (GGDEF)-like protein
MAGQEGDVVVDVSRHVVLLTNKFDEYRMQLMQGMLPLLRAEGMSLLVQADDPFHTGISVPLESMLRHAPPLGVFVTLGATSARTELFELLTELDVPYESTAMSSFGSGLSRIDNAAAMRAVLAHLLDDRGVRRPVLVLGSAGQRDALEREAVVREELARRNIPLDEDLVVNGDFDFAVAYGAVHQLLKTRRDMDAIVACNDLSALGAWRALTESGLEVPRDVLVTGFDNEPGSFMNWPGLTTVEQRLTNHGAAAAAGLVAQIRDEDRPAEVVLPTELIIRGSTGMTGRTAAEERDIAAAMAQAAQRQIADQDALLAFNQAMIRCGTIADVVDALASTYLDRLGIRRCVLALYEPGTAELRTGDAEATVRVLLDSWDGEIRPAPAEPLPVHELLRRDLGEQVLICQPLSVAGRLLGCVLFEHPRTMAALPEILRLVLSRTLGGVLNSQELRENAKTLAAQVALRTRELEQEVSTRRRAEAELQRLNEELQRSLMLDGLTRIANRAAFQQHLELHGRGENGERKSLALLFVDVDLFKAYNDHYGHVAGDEALVVVASCLAQTVRYPQDLACRWGGEEFAMLLPGSGAQEAVIVAGRFMALLKAARIPHAASSVSKQLTASVGIAVMTSARSRDPADLITAADQALYRAKESGRNRVCQADEIT